MGKTTMWGGGGGGVGIARCGVGRKRSNEK